MIFIIFILVFDSSKRLHTDKRLPFEGEFIAAGLTPHVLNVNRMEVLLDEMSISKADRIMTIDGRTWGVTPAI